MVRGIVLFALVMGFVFSGCTDAPADPVDHRDQGSQDAQGDDDEGEGNESLVLDAPELAPGDSWSYVTDGYWDSVPELTVVVAHHNDDGTLFAARHVGELDDEVAWDLPYLGETDEGLRMTSSYGGVHGARLLDFPLEPGKTWTYWDLEVTARPAMVPVAGEEHEGYRIEGEDDGRRVVVEYSPQVGYITFFEEFSKSMEVALWSLTLTGTASEMDWVWYERGEEVIGAGYDDVGNTTPKVLEVVEEDDRVFVWAMGSSGSRGWVAPPPQGDLPWTFEGEGVPNAKKAHFDAVAGSWTLGGLPGDPEGWVYLQGHALRFSGPGWDGA